MKKIRNLVDAVETCRENPELLKELPDSYREIMARLIDEMPGKLGGVHKPGRVAPAQAP